MSLSSTGAFTDRPLVHHRSHHGRLLLQPLSQRHRGQWNVLASAPLDQAQVAMLLLHGWTSSDTRLASKRRVQLRGLVSARGGEPPPATATPSGSARAGRVSWAELLRRVYAADVLACPCGSRRTVTAFVDTHLARRWLTALGLAAQPATFAPARNPPQAESAWDDPA